MRRSTSPERTLLVLLFVAAFLGATAVLYGTPGTASAGKPQCNNRTDDDGDGKIDYPTDPGCTGRGDKSEVDPVQPPPLPPPPPPGIVIDDFCDTTAWVQGNLVNRWKTAFIGADPYSLCTATSGPLGPWTDGSGMWEISTPYGPGFKFVGGDQTQVASGGKKVEIHGHNGPQIGTMGKTYDFQGSVMWPAAGNAFGFPRNWPDWNGFWNVKTNLNNLCGCSFGWGVDTTDGPPSKTNIFFSGRSTNPAWKAISPNPVVYDHWYTWRVEVKWSAGSDGFLRAWLDGVQIANWTGWTADPNAVRWMQLGWYSALSGHTHDLRMGPIKITVS